MWAGLAQRARIVLHAADGVANAAIAERVGVSGLTVLVWRDRYEEAGSAGLVDLDRSGRPRTVDHRRIVSVTLAPPPKKYGVTHWSTRLLARHLRVGDATIARAWRKYGVQPWRTQTFKFSTDPQLVARVTDVVGFGSDRSRNARPDPSGGSPTVVRGRAIEVLVEGQLQTEVVDHRGGLLPVRTDFQTR